MARKWIAIDDLDLVDGQETRADATVVLGLAVGGKWVILTELDLSAAHVDEAAQSLKRYAAAGNTPSNGLPSVERKHGSPASPGLKGARDYGAAIRDWAQARGFYFTTPGGSYYYRDELKEAFAHWTETGQEPPAGLAAFLREPPSSKTGKEPGIPQRSAEA